MAGVHILKSLIMGFAMGVVVGAFNHWLVWSLLKKIEIYSPVQGKNKLMTRYLMRYLINGAIMATFFLHKDTYILIGTAVGLVVSGKFWAINFTFFKKGVN